MRQPAVHQLAEARTLRAGAKLLEFGGVLGVGVVHIGEPQAAGCQQLKNVAPASTPERPHGALDILGASFVRRVRGQLEARVPSPPHVEVVDAAIIALVGRKATGPRFLRDGGL